MSSTIRKPWCMTAVQTWTVLAPRRKNSTASRHVPTPPMPEIGSWKRGSRARAAHMCSAMGRTAGPQ